MGDVDSDLVSRVCRAVRAGDLPFDIAVEWEARGRAAWVTTNDVRSLVFLAHDRILAALASTPRRPSHSRQVVGAWVVDRGYETLQKVKLDPQPLAFGAQDNNEPLPALVDIDDLCPTTQQLTELARHCRG